ncbi:low temperature requirement protein A [Micromonospora sp. STR1_7]|uniref:Low temperature requirement protein A n=1 Tax=Micromonospora parastrephiae TaxID=2806101 RepID=A0ABS1XWB1_9ACTN|nr:low temperature requirement protein A [Micromonospora parastrephiae]MBM0233552.1 low temperature requirement protein A [Micromonospora parastrephiae]
MRGIFDVRPVPAGDRHRTTMFEIFFDLVFVFALTRVITFMAQPPTALTLAQGLLLLLLLIYSWGPYLWLGNLVRADVGPARAATLLAMAAIFVAALVLPDAWRQGPGLFDAPLTLALAYLVTRAVQLVVLLWASTDDRRLRSTLRFFAVPVAAAWLPLVVGALLGGVAQTVLWTVAFLVDIGGARVASAFRPWPLGSLDHFTERFGLVLIIALGEALIAAGTGPRTMAPTGAALVAALLGLVITICLWWLYFDRLAPAARNSVMLVPDERRSDVAGDAYGLAHAPLIIGAIYVALGIEQALGQLTEEPSHPARLSWPAATALYGGAALYLLARLVFRRLTLRTVRAGQVVAAVVPLVLLPVARSLPALAELALLTLFLIGVTGYERRVDRRDPPIEPARPVRP